MAVRSSLDLSQVETRCKACKHCFYAAFPSVCKGSKNALHARLKILVSAVRFRPQPPFITNNLQLKTDYKQILSVRLLSGLRGSESSFAAVPTDFPSDLPPSLARVAAWSGRDHWQSSRRGARRQGVSAARVFFAVD